MDNQFNSGNNQLPQNPTQEDQANNEKKITMDGLVNSLNSPEQTEAQTFEPLAVSQPTPIIPNIANNEPVQNPTSTQTSRPSLSMPITSSELKTKKSSMSLIIFSLLIVIIVLVGVYGTYRWQHNKVNSLTSQVQSLNSQLSNSQSQITKLTASQSSKTVQNLFEVKELAIQFAVPTILADLTYSTNSENTVINVSSQSLTGLDSACASNVTKGKALGDIYKINGQFPKTSGSIILIKQYPTYYIAYNAPSSSCSTIPQINNFASTLIGDLKNSFSSIELIQ